MNWNTLNKYNWVTWMISGMVEQMAIYLFIVANVLYILQKITSSFQFSNFSMLGISLLVMCFCLGLTSRKFGATSLIKGFVYGVSE